MLYGGLATIIDKAITTSVSNGVDSNGHLKNQNYNYSLCSWLSNGFNSIPIKIEFSKKIKKAIDLMNEDAKNPKVGIVK